MSYITPAQLAHVKEIDLLSYLKACEPQELKETGPHEYCTVTHDSLKISNGKWQWFSHGIGGKTALDYLIHVRGMRFLDAALLLCKGIPAPIPVKQVKQSTPPLKPFELPERNSNNKTVIGYLRGRGIDPDIIELCIKSGTLYESREHHNCVFVGRDAGGTPRFAFMRGTEGDFKQDVEGSDKRYGFALPSCPQRSRIVAVFESPIDALSLATIRKIESSAWNRYHFLSLGGTSPLALLQYLTDHPEIDYVYLRLDNDRAGLDGMLKIRAALNKTSAFYRHIVTAEPPSVGKDYNEYLQHRIQQLEPKMKAQNSRPVKQMTVLR